MGILGIIPARFASTRFPGKPLVEINGRPMILHVYNQARLSGVFEDIIVATDDERIFQTVTSQGSKAVMTSPEHGSGTERCLEALNTWEINRQKPFEYVINIQGDEPFIHPDQIRKVATMLNSGKIGIATLAKKINPGEDIFDPNVVKVVFSTELKALYFSREALPHVRGLGKTDWQSKGEHYKHIGIYGFKSDTLRSACQLPPGRLEKLESLEQLRWLEHGLSIHIDITDLESISIDTPEDLLKITITA